MHSVAGLSGAARFIACPGSIRLGWNSERTSNIYAHRGTMCHEINEKCLLTGATPESFLGRCIEVEGDEFIVDAKDVSGCRMFLDTVMADYSGMRDPKELHTEMWINMDWVHKLTYPDFGPPPEGFTLEFGGTADVRLQEYMGLLRVYDYKNGSGKIVEVEHNPQLMGYGLGALGEDNLNMIEEVELIIVQPHAPHKNGHTRHWRTTPEELYEWKDDVLIPALKETERPDAPLRENEHCWFCPGKDNCPLKRQHAWAKSAKAFME